MTYFGDQPYINAGELADRLNFEEQLDLREEDVIELYKELDWPKSSPRPYPAIRFDRQGFIHWHHDLVEMLVHGTG